MEKEKVVTAIVSAVMIFGMGYQLFTDTKTADIHDYAFAEKETDQPEKEIREKVTLHVKPSESMIAGAYVSQIKVPSVYFTQHDARWNNARIGGYTFGDTGCVFSALASVLSTKKYDISPYELGVYMYRNSREYNRDFMGASSRAIPLTLDQWDMDYEGIKDLDGIREALDSQKMVTFAVGIGRFCAIGTHEILLSGLLGDKTYVYDPAHPERNGWYDLEMIWNMKSRDPIDMKDGYLAYGISI